MFGVSCTGKPQVTGLPRDLHAGRTGGTVPLAAVPHPEQVPSDEQAQWGADAAATPALCHPLPAGAAAGQATAPRATRLPGGAGWPCQNRYAGCNLVLSSPDPGPAGPTPCSPHLPCHWPLRLPETNHQAGPCTRPAGPRAVPYLDGSWSQSPTCLLHCHPPHVYQLPVTHSVTPNHNH